MIPNADNEQLIRRYLLGDLAQEDLTRVEIRLLEDAEFAAQVQLVEGELLEAYLDGTLSVAERKQCETHFLSIPARQRQLTVAKALCRYAAQAGEVTVTNNLNQSTPPLTPAAKGWWAALMPFDGTRGWQLVVVAMFVAAIGWGAWRIWLAPSQVERGLRILHNAYNKQRLVEARITGFGHAPLSLTRGKVPTNIDYRARELAEKQFLEAVVEQGDATAYHALGRAYLAKQEFGKAIEQFETALKFTPDVATLHSDLGAALVEKIRSEGAESASRNQPELIERAFRELDRATALNEHLLEPIFNRALLYQMLHLKDPARQAWQNYLLKDNASSWAEEARHNLEEVQKSSGRASRTPVNQYTEFLQACQAGDSETAWELYNQAHLRFGNHIITTLVDNFLALSVLSKDDQAQTLIRHLDRLSKFEEKKTGDRFNTALTQVYQKASAKQRSMLSQGRVLRKQAYEFSSQAKHDQALKLHQAARQLFTQAGASIEIAVTDYWIGEAHLRLSEHHQSLAIFAQALSHCEQEHYWWWQALILNRLASVHSDLEEFSTAIKCSLKAQQIFTKLQDQNGKLRALTTLSGLYRDTGQSRSAIQIAQQALLLADQLAVDDSWIIMSYAVSASSFGNLKLLTTALEFQKEAVRLAVQLKNPQAVSRYQVQLGLLYEKRGDFPAAIREIRQGLEAGVELQQAATELDIRNYALLHLGRVYRRVGNYPAALQALEEAASFYQSKSAGWEAPAYLVERERLLVQIALNHKMEAEQSLARVLEQFEANRKKILQASFRNSFFDMQQEVYDAAIKFAEEALNKPVRALEYSELSRSRSLLDAASAAYAMTFESGLPDITLSASISPLALTQIQQKLPADTQIVEYALLDDRIIIWVISKEHIRSHVVRVRASEVSDTVKAYLDQLDTPADGLPDLELRKLANDLHQLLIGPVEPELDKHKLLCLVPDKILSFLPYGALVSPQTGRYVLEDYTLLLAPSATLFIWNSEVAAQKTEASRERLLSVGNPEFNHDLFPDLPRLPSAEREAEAITAFYPQHTILVGKDARKDTLLSCIANAEVVHLAMHYVSDERTAMLSGLILAPLSLHTKQDSVEQSKLSMHEVYRLNLPKTKLVVLSACQTGIEEYFKGEGAIGLARPFTTAGVPLVIASLWPVDSVATQQVMVNFHELRHNQHLPTLRALQEAQLKLVRNSRKELQHPYYWAAFVAIGGHARY